MSVAEPSFDTSSEKRIRRIVYCADQLVMKRRQLYATRYDRALSEAQSVAELDEAMRRIHAKHPKIGLDKIIDEQQDVKDANA